jgi:ABC-type antimicrobial peptide transport system permease subunit
MVLREGLVLCGLGIATGMLIAIALGRLATSLLYGVSAFDAPTYATVIAVIVATVVIACWVPALRASRVNPTVALRAE